MPPDRRFRTDRTPIDARVVVIVGAVLVAVATAVVAAMLAWHATPLGRPTVPRAVVIERAPTLQTEPGADREAFDAGKRALLGRYEWIDRERGVVRIPIERAMQVLAERGR